MANSKEVDEIYKRYASLFYSSIPKVEAGRGVEVLQYCRPAGDPPRLRYTFPAHHEPDGWPQYCDQLERLWEVHFFLRGEAVQVRFRIVCEHVRVHCV